MLRIVSIFRLFVSALRIPLLNFVPFDRHALTSFVSFILIRVFNVTGPFYFSQVLRF